MTEDEGTPEIELFLFMTNNTHDMNDPILILNSHLKLKSSILESHISSVSPIQNDTDVKEHICFAYSYESPVSSVGWAPGSFLSVACMFEPQLCLLLCSPLRKVLSSHCPDVGHVPIPAG